MRVCSVKKAVEIALVCVLLTVLSSEAAGGQKSYDVKSELIIFHAGSLAVPFKQICAEFNKSYPNVKINSEAAGSRICARKISELNRTCDIMASSDYTVIDSLLIDKHAKWNIRFASNEMVIAFRADSRMAETINTDNWPDILLRKDVTFGRSDPNSDPCGYRSVFVMSLAEKFYNRPGLVKKMLAKDKRYIRPKETDLLALLEVKELDYIFIYRSVAQQHKLKYLCLPDELSLKQPGFSELYKSVSIRLAGKEPGTFITKTASAIVYGVTIPDNAANPELALTFLQFMLDADKGGAILTNNGQNFIVPAPTDTFDKLPKCLKTFAIPVKKDKRELTVQKQS